MIFSLHAGIAIEGVIGSQFKIDTTYLSQDISIGNFIKT